jgi:hypothetical protein
MRLLLLILILALISWTHRGSAVYSFTKVKSGDSVLSNDVRFINQELLKGRFELNLKPYDTFSRSGCKPELLNRRETIANFEGFHNVGDIDGDKKVDYVFVLSPINRCEEGQSYYFSNSAIPRIETESHCCHPESVFSVGDIDEDGRNELGEYYSSCASRYKAITIWSFKAGRWKEIKSFSYVLNDSYKVFKDFHKMFKKSAKGKISYLEITDVDVNGDLISNWKTVTVR